MDKNFHDLLTRYARGQCTKQEVERLHQWYEQIGDDSLGLGEDEKRLIKERMHQRIQEVLSADAQPSGKGRWLEVSPLKVAAVILLLALAAAGYFAGFYSFSRSSALSGPWIAGDQTIENSSDESKSYQLSDGSTVMLEPSAIIRLPVDFSASAREVELTGKAFFEIVKDPARPFYVYSGHIATRVLGTSFFVDAPANAEKVEVKVITGRVSVFQIHSDRFDKGASGLNKSVPNGVVLSPNQKVEYFVEEGHWVTGLVEEPLPVNSVGEEAPLAVFDNTPVKEVFEYIHEKYGIEVVTETEHIDRCTFTGDVSSLSLYDMLDVVTNSIGSGYEVKGTRILVSGKGCN